MCVCVCAGTATFRPNQNAVPYRKSEKSVTVEGCRPVCRTKATKKVQKLKVILFISQKGEKRESLDLNAVA